MKRARLDVAQVGGEIAEQEISTAQFDSLAHKLAQHAKRYRQNATLKGRLVSSGAWNAQSSFEQDVQAEIDADRSLYASVHAISEGFPDAEWGSEFFEAKLKRVDCRHIFSMTNTILCHIFKTCHFCHILSYFHFCINPHQSDPFVQSANRSTTNWFKNSTVAIWTRCDS